MNVERAGANYARNLCPQVDRDGNSAVLSARLADRIVEFHD